MRVLKLTENEASVSGFTHIIKVEASDLTETAANTAQTIEVAPTVVGSAVSHCAMRLITPFEDASDGAFNTTLLEVGDGVDPNRFLTATQLNVNGTEVLAKITANSVATLPFAYEIVDTVDLVFGSQSAKSLVDIDVGEVWIYIHLFDLTSLTVG